MVTVVSLVQRGEGEPRLIDLEKTDKKGRRVVTILGVEVIDTNGTAAANLGAEQTRVNFPSVWNFTVVDGDPKKVTDVPGKKPGQKAIFIQTEAEVRLDIPENASAQWKEMVIVRK